MPGLFMIAKEKAANVAAPLFYIPLKFKSLKFLYKMRFKLKKAS